MKKLLCIILILSAAGFSYAQKGSVNKAKSYRAKGDLINAKAEIDMAVTIEKVAAKSATWFERGEIYRTILTSTDEAISGIDSEAFQKSLEGYKKVLSMEKETAPSAFLASQNIDALWSFHVNTGGEQYGNEKYMDAYKSFVNALVVKPEDSITLLYAGVAAQLSEFYDKTLEHYYKMSDLDVASADNYSTMIYIERSINKDNEKALEVIQVAKGKYPADTRISQEEIAILINLDRLDQAKEKLATEIERDPTNVNLYLNLAIMHDNLGSSLASEDKTEEAEQNYEIAKQNYKKAVELDPENYVGNFNLGAIYVNAAKVYFDQVRDMDLKTYDKKGPAMTEKANGILEIGLPYMLKATELKPEDTSALGALQQMYTQLKRYDEAEAIMNRLDALEAGKE